MRKVFFEKANIANPDSYKSKLKAFEKSERAAAKLKRTDSTSSIWSMS
jgi:hypothetical protein